MNAYICSNSEVICDGYTDDRTAAWKDEIAAAFVEAAAASLRESGVDYDVAGNFRDWNGGRFYQFYDRCGLIAIARDASEELKAAAWKAEEAASQARDFYIAELEAEADAYAAENQE